MTDELADRVTLLEEQAAHQAKTIEELSDELARQYRRCEDMERRLKHLADRFMALEEQALTPHHQTKPPHY